MFKKLKEIQVLKSLTIKECVIIMDGVGRGFCVCIDNLKKVIGVMTDGDFRRGVLNGLDLNNPIESIINQDFLKIEEGTDRKDIKNMFLTTSARAIPVINSDGSLHNIFFKEDFFDEQEADKIKEKFPKGFFDNQ